MSRLIVSHGGIFQHAQIKPNHFELKKDIKICFDPKTIGDKFQANLDFEANIMTTFEKNVDLILKDDL
jgi:hypothetical protein